MQEQYLDKRTNQALFTVLIFNAYAFQFYYLQVIQTLQDDYGEHQAYKEEGEDSKIKQKKYPCMSCISARFSLGLNTVFALFVIYSILVGILYFSLLDVKDIEADG